MIFCSRSAGILRKLISFDRVPCPRQATVGYSAAMTGTRDCLTGGGNPKILRPAAERTSRAVQGRYSSEWKAPGAGPVAPRGLLPAPLEVHGRVTRRFFPLPPVGRRLGHPPRP